MWAARVLFWLYSIGHQPIVATPHRTSAETINKCWLYSPLLPCLLPWLWAGLLAEYWKYVDFGQIWFIKCSFWAQSAAFGIRSQKAFSNNDFFAQINYIDYALRCQCVWRNCMFVQVRLYRPPTKLTHAIHNKRRVWARVRCLVYYHSNGSEHFSLGSSRAILIACDWNNQTTSISSIWY